jgi:hypothetical protein
VQSSKFGKFVITSEAGFAEEALLGLRSLVLGTGIFNKYYEAQFVSSTKKRIYAFEEREKTVSKSLIFCHIKSYTSFTLEKK